MAEQYLTRKAEEIEFLCQMADNLGFLESPAELFVQMPQQGASL